MAAENRTLEPGRKHGVGDQFQPVQAGVLAFIDMEIQAQAVGIRLPEDLRQTLFPVGVVQKPGPQNPAIPRDLPGNPGGGGGVGKGVDRGKAGQFQGDAVRPVLCHFGKDAPAAGGGGGVCALPPVDMAAGVGSSASAMLARARRSSSVQFALSASCAAIAAIRSPPTCGRRGSVKALSR